MSDKISKSKLLFALEVMINECNSLLEKHDDFKEFWELKLMLIKQKETLTFIADNVKCGIFDVLQGN